MNKINSLLDATGKNLVTRIKQNLISTGTNATGQTSDSLEYLIKETNVTTEMTVLARPFFAGVETGRAPRKGSEPSNLSEKILQWMNVRGIGASLTEKKRINLSKFITWRINTFGTKLYQKGGRDNIFTEPFNEEMVNFRNEVSNAMIEGISEHMINSWNVKEK